MTTHLSNHLSTAELRHELFNERIARQRAETRLADCQRQLAELRREHDWGRDSGLYWTGDDGPDLNKVVG